MDAPALIVKYGKPVWVTAALDEQRPELCMCMHCARFKPGQKDHCFQAQRLYDVCRVAGNAAIVTRCRDWEPITQRLWQALTRAEQAAWLKLADARIAAIAPLLQPWAANLAYEGAQYGRLTLWHDGDTLDLGRIWIGDTPPPKRARGTDDRPGAGEGKDA